MNTLPYLFFFLSGLSALIYQTAWQRTLGLFSGSDAVAASLVVGAFLFGLGLGSVAAASFADRLSHRGAIRAFAACELGIAAFALASRFLFYDLVFGQGIALARSPALILAIVFLALLPPTALMGMSLPLLAKAIVARVEMAPSSIGWLYGVNTLGAAVGTLLGGFYVMGTFGYEVAVYLGAIVNLLIGASALVAASSASAAIPERADAGGPEPKGMTSRVWLWSLLVFGSGFLIVALEIVWLRVLGLLMQTDAYAFSVVLFVFLASDALGIVYGALTIGRVADPKRFFLLAQGAMAAYALLSLGLVGLGHTWFDLPRFFVEAPHHGTEASASEMLTRFLVHFGLAVAVVAPPGFLAGMTFPIAQKAIQDDAALVGQRVGVIQLFNILGNAVGALVAGLLLLHWLGTSGTVRVIAVLGLLFVGALLGERPRTSGALLILLLASLVALFPSNETFWMRLHGATPREGALADEDRTGVAVLRSSGQGQTLYIGGHHQSQVPFSHVHGALGALGPLVHPSPRSVLVIGHGTGGTPYASGANPATEHILVVEIVAPVFSVMERFTREGGGTVVSRVFADPRFERIVADARHVLFTDERRYDVIQADAIYPWASHGGLLYSVEFFRQVRERLREGGICVQWMPTDRTLATFLQVFPHVVRVNGALLGSDRPIPFDIGAVAERLRGSARPYLLAGGLDPEEILSWLSQERVQVWAPGDRRGDRDVNTDLFPRDEYFLNKRKITLFASAGPRPTAPTSAALDRRPHPQPVLFATPNPVPEGPGLGTTEIAWDLREETTGAIMVSVDGGTPRPFAAGARGADKADWIRTGARYEFRLYRGDPDLETAVASLVVTRGGGAPALVIIGWCLGALSLALVVVWRVGKHASAGRFSPLAVPGRAP